MQLLNLKCNVQLVVGLMSTHGINNKNEKPSFSHYISPNKHVPAYTVYVTKCHFSKEIHALHRVVVASYLQSPLIALPS